MRSALHAGLLVILGLAWSAAAWPHAGSNAYLFFSTRDADVETRVDFAVRDLDELYGLDGNGDGQLSWAEVEQGERDISGYARTHLRLSSRDIPCEPGPSAGRLQAVEHADGWYAVIRLRHRCGSAGAIRAEYSGLFDLDASHRAQVRIESGGAVSATLLTPDRRSVEIGAGRTSATGESTLLVYLRSGVRHVLTGLDHLLFLVGLFLPAALLRVRGGWRPMPDLPSALRRSGLIVSAFTLAHAVTLCIVVLGVVTPPMRVVESLVALSVAFAGFNNLVPLVQERRLVWLAGGFGLVHGASVAGVLLDMGLPTSSRVMALLGFNLGVEFAQLIPVLLAVLMTWPLRSSTGYRRLVLIPGSVLVTMLGLVWLTTRVLDLPSPI